MRLRTSVFLSFIVIISITIVLATVAAVEGGKEILEK